MNGKLDDIVAAAARLNPETAFDRGWEGGRAFERERCAKIADSMPRGASFSDEFENGHDDACKRIATAIRIVGQ